MTNLGEPNRIIEVGSLARVVWADEYYTDMYQELHIGISVIEHAINKCMQKTDEARKDDYSYIPVIVVTTNKPTQPIHLNEPPIPANPATKGHTGTSKTIAFGVAGLLVLEKISFENKTKNQIFSNNEAINKFVKILYKNEIYWIPERHLRNYGKN